MLKTIWTIAFFSFGLCLYSQQASDGWSILKMAKFKEVYFKEYSSFVPVPVIDEKLKAWQGKDVQLKGYVIPDAEMVESFKGIILSKFPYSQCFFCGMAGPESIAEIQLKSGVKKPRFYPDRVYVFKGKLRFNNKDLNHFNFILGDAVILQE